MKVIDFTKHINHTLWCVYGPNSFPSMFCCTVKMNSGAICVWGYSVWKRQPGFRTLGIRVESWVKENPSAVFFTDQTEALELMRELTTPKCTIPLSKQEQLKEALLIIESLNLEESAKDIIGSVYE